MSTVLGLAALAGGIALVVWAADVSSTACLAWAGRWASRPFVLTVALSGFETENLAAGIAANAKCLAGAAAGTFLGGITFPALGVAGLAAVIAPMQLELPPGFAIWTAVGPVPLLLFGLDGRLSRVEGAVLVAWSVVALVGLARSGSALLADENGERVRSPGVRLLAGLVVLTGGGWLLGQGLTSTVRNLGISPTLLAIPPWPSRSRPRTSPALRCPLAAVAQSWDSAISARPWSTSRRSTRGCSRSSNRSRSGTTPRTSTSPPRRQAQLFLLC